MGNPLQDNRASHDRLSNQEDIMSKRYLPIVALLMAVVFALAACGGGALEEAEEPAAEEPAAEEPAEEPAAEEE
jgi:hypothetical protein